MEDKRVRKRKASGRMPFFLDENEGFFIRFLDMVIKMALGTRLISMEPMKMSFLFRIE